MAYSDYGGYAYRNGQRIEERSDAVLTTEGIKSSPGAWPGWSIPEGRNGGSHHALLGDGPIHVGLYKQSSVSVFRLGEELNVADLVTSESKQYLSSYEYKGKKVSYLDSTELINYDKVAVLEVDGWRIEIKFTHEDNYYVYARVTQPDGVVWTGFSGYGVGAGLEDAGYGFDTQEREDNLREFFP